MKHVLFYYPLTLLGICGSLFVDPSLSAAQVFPLDWKRIPATYLNKRVIDGDTFDIDLNQDGRFDKKKERVRLLYVDTPELSDSHKGKDLKFGLPAKTFLNRVLNAHQSYLWVNPQNQYDQYGRILAIVEVRQRNINLELIRLGYSYFDTRFSLPVPYQSYAQKESEAFSNYRGIWSTAQSRSTYLQRLKNEGKTVSSLQNDLFVPDILQAQSLKLENFLGRFILLKGKITHIISPHPRLHLLFLQNAYSSEGLRVVLFKNRQKITKLKSLKIGDFIYVEGFVARYRNHLQVVLHRGHLLPSIFSHFQSTE